MALRPAADLALFATTMLAALPLAEAAQAQSANDSTLQRMNAIESQIKVAAGPAALHAARPGRPRHPAARGAARGEPRPRGCAARPGGRGLAARGAALRARRRPAAPGQPQGRRARPRRSPPGLVRPAPARSAPGSRTPRPRRSRRQLGTFRLGGVTVSLGGFIELAGIFRSRNEVADIGSNFNTGIPLPQSALYHENEFRASSRQSRLSLLVQGDVDPHQKLAAYFETDFQGSAPTANSVESNSYNLRLRQAYGTYDNTDLGFHFLGGQAWSLLRRRRSASRRGRRTSRSPSTRNTSSASTGPGSRRRASSATSSITSSGPACRSKARRRCSSPAPTAPARSAAR